MRIKLSALIVVIAVLLSGCGSSAHRTTAPTLPSTGVSLNGGHPCSRKDLTMQCVLSAMNVPTAQVQALPQIAQSTNSNGVQYGIDFAWSCPNFAGKAFGASYLSWDFSKNWSRACVQAFHSGGAATVAVWETSANRAAAGCSAGAADAREASAQLANLGAPDSQPFTMAIDFDAQGWQVADYFHCANQVEPGRVNAYGGYNPLQYLCAHGLVGHLNWQTYAWSGGRWLPASCAPLEQYLNSSSVDYDRALLPVYGQWPAPAPSLPPFNPHYELYANGATPSTMGILHERGTVERYDQLRRVAHPNAGELRWLERRLGALMWTVYHRAHDFKPPAWNTPQHRAFRFDGLKARYEGHLVG